jgi:hypothetical protein
MQVRGGGFYYCENSLFEKMFKIQVPDIPVRSFDVKVFSSPMVSKSSIRLNIDRGRSILVNMDHFHLKIINHIG